MTLAGVGWTPLDSGRRAPAWPYRVSVVGPDPHLTAGTAEEFAERGFLLEAYSDGVSALLGAATEPPAIVLVDTALADVLLPSFVGGLTAWLDVAVLPIIREGMAEAAHAAVSAGARGLLYPPVTPSSLSAAARNAGFARTESAAPRIVGAVSLDAVGYRVRVAEREIAVTPKEFAYLRHLMDRSPAVVSLAELQDAFPGEALSLEAVRTTISRLQRKLASAAASAAGLLRNVRGRGYVLAASNVEHSIRD